MTPPDCILSAHTRLAREGAEAAVLQWLEECGLDVEYGAGDRWIAWPGADQPVADAGPTVEVQFYVLPGSGSQVRWHFRPAGPDPAAGILLRELALELQARLRDDPLWGIDQWRDGGPGGVMAGP
jgi:hypothetical protein